MKKLAIIGASYLQLPLVEKAKELGIETHCFAWSSGAVCQEICDFFYDISTLEKELILGKCNEIGIDGVMTIASDIAVPTVCYVANKLSLIGNSFENSYTTTNKYLMRNALIKSNIKSPKFQLIQRISDVSLVKEMQYPLIVKPTDRSGSRGVVKINNKKELISSVERALKESFSNEAIIEEYIEGDEVSVESISWEGKHYILAITDKVTTGAPYFVELQHHQPSSLSSDIKKQIIKNTVDSLTALSHKFGAAHSEFKIDKNGDVYVIEVGARMGGDFIGSDLVQLSTGYDFLKACIDVCFGKFEIPTLTANGYSGVYFLCKEYEWLKEKIISMNESFIYKAEIQVDEIKSIQCSADRSGYLIYKSDKKIKLI